jgi:LAO/AO transport system kinase
MSDIPSNQLVEGILKRDQRFLAKAVSIVENRNLGFSELLDSIYSKTGKAKVIGITGSPGSGKSTLISLIVQELTLRAKTVAILAVDPSSPFSGGAVLGDRVRMQSAATANSVFIRSLASRGEKGGISAAVPDLIDLFDAAGFDYIIVESVGVGQIEFELRDYVQMLLLTLNPESGDEVQFFKAGIFEVTDIFVLTKSDLPGSDRFAADLINTLSVDSKLPEVSRTSKSGVGVKELTDKLMQMQSKQSKTAEEIARKRIETEIITQIRNIFKKNMSPEINKLVEQVNKRTIHPSSASRKFLETMKNLKW